MYMDDLDIIVIDGQTQSIIATGSFATKGLHTYPEPKKVISDIFRKFDDENLF